MPLRVVSPVVGNKDVDTAEKSLPRPHPNTLLFYLNGKRITAENPSPQQTLLQYIRATGLTGSKLGCGEGGCGACTVLVSSYNPIEDKVSHIPINACLAPVCSMEGRHVITIEALGTSAKPHPVQDRIARIHGSQCGFCTPGIVMSMYALLRTNPRPSEEDIEDAFDGNLCRCTGYRPILDAAKTFSAPSGCCKDGSGKASGGCCRTPTMPDGPSENTSSISVSIPTFSAYDPSQEIIFPPSLILAGKRALSAPPRETTMFTGEDGSVWYHPFSLAEALRLRRDYPSARLIGGNSEVGVELRARRQHLPISIYLSHESIPELSSIRYDEDTGIVAFGGNITLEDLAQHLRSAPAAWAPHEREFYATIREALKYFAGKQIRSVATIAGNLATASPISDLSPVWIALGASVELASLSEDGVTIARRLVPISEFFLSYRRTLLDAPSEIILAIHTRQRSAIGEYAGTYKASRRKEDDIALVNIAIRLRLNLSVNPTIQECHISYGGLAPIPLYAVAASKACVGASIAGPNAVQDLLAHIREALFDGDLQGMDLGTPGGMPVYRLAIASSLLERLIHRSLVSHAAYLQSDPSSSDLSSPVTPQLSRLEKAEELDRFVSGGRQTHGTKGLEGRMHVSALKQVTGEAEYVDDQTPLANELYAALVLSTRPCGSLLSVDPTAALALPGVHGYYGAEDIPGENGWAAGPVHDERVFAIGDVRCVGDIIGVVVADTPALAAHAARHAVKVEYGPREESTPILTIDEAISAESFIPGSYRVIERGLAPSPPSNGTVDADAPIDSAAAIDAALAACPHVFSGEYSMGGQEHFYLETQACRIVPMGEDGREFEVFSSTQNPAETQTVIAEVLGLAAAQVTTRVRRLGGGFGGKETRSIPLAAALAVPAFHLRRPVRLHLERDDDMLISGQRNPFKGFWRVGLSEDGMLRALDLRVYANAGCTADLTMAVVERCMSHADNCYFIPHVRVQGWACRTNLASNTAYRGFGGPQGMLFTEAILSEAADHLGMSVEAMRERNMYREGQLTHYSQPLTDWHIPLMWGKLKADARWEERREEVDRWNAEHPSRKRGLAMIPTKFGISFTARHLNQAAALVHIYTDGTVLLSHGGTEMGQGLHTKMVQLCAETLGIPHAMIYIRETSTASVANTSPTAASASSDLNGAAVVDACRRLRDRLAPYIQASREALSGDVDPGIIFTKAVKAAYFDRVHLSETGFYKTPKIGYNWTTHEGQMYYYYTMGVAVTEVELDTLTGEHRVRRADILMDVGHSLNPSIDIGQIEGAFTQGQGWSTMEQSVYTATGNNLTLGPGSYKIPGFRDIPEDFRVHLLDGVSYPDLGTIRSSKGVGEPPFFLGTSVLFAVRDAIKATRADNPGLTRGTPPLRLYSPATVERIRVAIGDEVVRDATARVTERSATRGVTKWGLAVES